MVYILTPILIFFPTSQILEKINKKNLFIICFIIQIILSINILNNIPQEKYSFNAEALSKKILINNGNYLLCSNLFDPLFLYYAVKNEVEINKVDLSKNLKCDAEKIKNYDWIVIDKLRDKSKRKPVFDSLLWNFYKS